MSATKQLTDLRRAPLRALDSVWERWNSAPLFIAPAASSWPIALRRVRTIGLVLLAVQCAVLIWWSADLVDHFAVTWDFAFYQQALYLISHGHMDPTNTLIRPYGPFWRNLGEFLFWPLAVVERIWPSPVTLKVLQALALTGGEVIAFLWGCDILAARTFQGLSRRLALALAALALVLILTNPWIYWSASFDAHNEPFAGFFLIGVARELYYGRRRVWFWVFGTLLCGATAGTYLAALGISMMLTSRERLRRAGTAFAAGAFWVIFLSAVHGISGGGIEYYSNLLGPKPTPEETSSTSHFALAVAKHPGRVVDTVWGNRSAIWGIISPAGAIGVLWLPVLVPSLLIVGESALSSPLFAVPGNQNIALAPLAVVGTIAILAALASRTSRRSAMFTAGISVALALNGVAWAATWLPHMSRQWLHVSDGAASVLSRVQSRIKPSDAVIADNGVLGDFSSREYVYPIAADPLGNPAAVLAPNQKGMVLDGHLPGAAQISFPLHSRRVWLILTPAQGIEVTPAAFDYSLVVAALHDPGMHLAVSGNGVWAFVTQPSRSAKQFKISGQVYGTLPAAFFAGAAGVVQNRKQLAGGYVSSTNSAGYVIDRDYWPAPVGNYEATTKLSVRGDAYVELWDDTTDRLLGRRTLTNTHGVTTVTLGATLTRKQLGSRTAGLYSGLGAWGRRPIPTVDGDRLEIRVWQPGHGTAVKVYSVRVVPIVAHDR